MESPKFSEKSDLKDVSPGHPSLDKISRKVFEEVLMLFGGPVQKAVMTDLIRKGAYALDCDYLEPVPVLDSLVSSFGHKGTDPVIKQVVMRSGNFPLD